ncbi:MAG: Eco57I restriction-modification methylase domain-containing protein [Candidatus Lokiarchaeota archaeon]|nr:Eco57I restriction-modification methylase domain-containing protein [Candidatus Lokiarchaeota archaeon]
MEKSKNSKYQNITIDVNKYFLKIEKLVLNNQKKEIRNELLNLDIVDIELNFLKSYLKRKNEGVYFTNNQVARFIIEKSILSLINMELNLKLNTLFEISTFEQEKKNIIINILKKITICDPACGSGVFLFNTLILLYDLFKKLKVNYSDLELKTLIIKNIYGLDINLISLNLCKLKIYKWILKEDLADYNLIFGILNKNIKLINSLTYSNWPNTIFGKKYFDLIIGNPPYGNILSTSDKNFLKKEKTFSKDIYCTYVLKSLEWSKNIIGLLIPKSFLLRQSFIDFRNELLAKANILKIYDLGPNLFKNATNEVQILIYKKKAGRDVNLEIFDYPDLKINQYNNQIIDSLRICRNLKCKMNVKTKKFYIYTFNEKCPYCTSNTQKLNRIRIKADKNYLTIIEKIEFQADMNYLNIRKFPNFIRGEEAKGLQEIKKRLNINGEGTCYFISAKQDFAPYYFNTNKKFDLEKVKPEILKGKKYEFYKESKLLIKHNNIYPEAIFTKQPSCFTSSIYSLLYSEDIELKYLCAIMNSILIQFYCIYGLNNQKDTTINLNQYMIRHLPIININKIEKKKISEDVDFIIDQLDLSEGKVNNQIKKKIINLDNKIFEYFSINDEERCTIINQVKKFNKLYKLIY